MVDTIFPPSPSNYYLSNVISTRVDGSLAYGSLNSIVILKHENNKIYPHIINEAHKERITSVVFSPLKSGVGFKNSILSSSEDGYVKLWNIESLSAYIGHNSHWDKKEAVKVVCASWSPCNPQYVVSAAENDTLVLWDIIENVTRRFTIRKLKPSVLDCSFHNEKIVAVGSVTGLIYVIKLVKNGEIVYKFRGHDKPVQSLSWCPVNASNIEDHSLFKQFPLASSSQENDIYIWRTVDDPRGTPIPLPKNALSSREELSYHGKSEISVLFVPLFWASPYVLYSGSKYGELLSFDIRRFLMIQSEVNDVNEKQLSKRILNCWKLVHCHHSNVLFEICGVPVGLCNRERENSQQTEKNHHGGSGHKDGCGTDDSADGTDGKEGSPVPEEGLIWTVGKEQKLVAVRQSNPSLTPVFNLHCVSGHVFGAVPSLHDPNEVAIAAGDGKIRFWKANKPSNHTRVFWQNINDRVYSLAWHPVKDGLLAYGTSAGRIGLIDIYNQKQAVNFKFCQYGTVYGLSWGPAFSENPDTEGEREFVLYSVGGHRRFCMYESNSIHAKMLNLGNILALPHKKVSDICWKPDFSLLCLGTENGSLFLLKPPRLELVNFIPARRKTIQSLTWHPASTTLDMDCSELTGYLTLGSTDQDPVIQVYNVELVDSNVQVSKVAALKGHTGYIQSVSWSTHAAGRLVSSSLDCTVRIWDVTKNVQLMKFTTTNSTLPLFCLFSPVDPDILIAGFAHRMALTWKISSTSSVSPIVREEKAAGQKDIRMSTHTDDSGTDAEKEPIAESAPNEEDMNGLALAKSAESRRTRKEIKMFAKVWQSNIDPLQNSYELLKDKGGKDDLNYIFPFLGSENQLGNFLNAEAETQKTANNWNDYYQLSLWRGNLNEILEEKIKTGHLDDFLLSLAPFASPRLWQQACVSYSKTLVDKKLYRKAACYLMAVHKVDDALSVLLNADLYLEAICIARCRLEESDPLFIKVVRSYADWLIKTGSYMKACECLIYLGEYLEAAEMLGRKNQSEYLSLAALAASKAGSKDLESNYAFSALLICLESHNWELASRICNDHSDLKGLKTLHATHRLIYQLDQGELTLENDLITHLNELTGTKADAAAYSALRYVYDQYAVYNDKKKLHIAVSRELSLACCAVDKGELMMHIIRAMNSASKYTKKEKDDVHPLHKLCTWLSPKGFLAQDSIFTSCDQCLKPRLKSLRAFLCQSIVEHMDSIFEQGNTDLPPYLSDLELTLRDLVDDVLDLGAYTFFKNQVTLKSCEKRITEVCQRKLQKKNEVAGVDVAVETRTETSESKSGQSERCNEGEYGNDGEVSDDELMATERNKITALKADMKEFENSRVIAPNPAFVYCNLRRVVQMFNCRDSSLSVEVIEEKWKRLEAA